jgi:hypothetical protein
MTSCWQKRLVVFLFGNQHLRRVGGVEPGHMATPYQVVTRREYDVTLRYQPGPEIPFKSHSA